MLTLQTLIAQWADCPGLFATYTEGKLSNMALSSLTDICELLLFHLQKKLRVLEIS